MASGTFVSRALGWVRNAMLVAAIGVNAGAANAYDIANKIPNSLYALLAAGVLNSALVPQIVKAFQRPNGKQIVDRILTIGTVVSLVAGAAFTIAAPVMVRMFTFTSDWTPEQTALATGFAYWVIPQLFFYGVYTLLGQVLNAREQFGPFMWAPVLNNVVAIIGLIAYLGIYGGYEAAPKGVVLAEDWTPERIALIGGVATLGIAAQALILLIPLVRGGYHWKWRWKGERGEMGTLGTVVTWALAAVALEQLGGLLTTQVTAGANPGDVDPGIAGNAAYFYAMTIYLVPHSLVTVSLLTALFTSMSRFHSAGDDRGLIGEISRGARLIGVFAIWATVTMIVVGPLLVRVMYPTLSAAESRSVTEVLWAFTIGLVPLGLMVLVKRVLFVLEDARAIFYIQIPMTIAWVGVAFGVQAVAPARWWTVGVALGLVASNVVAVVLRTVALKRRFGRLDGSTIVPVYAKALLGAGGASAVGALMLSLAPAPEELTGRSGLFTAAGLGLAIAIAMSVAYGIILKLLRVQELDLVLAPLMRKIRRVR